MVAFYRVLSRCCLPRCRITLDLDGPLSGLHDVPTPLSGISLGPCTAGIHTYPYAIFGAAFSAKLWNSRTRAPRLPPPAPQSPRSSRFLSSTRQENFGEFFTCFIRMFPDADWQHTKRHPGLFRVVVGACCRIRAEHRQKKQKNVKDF